MFIASLFPVVGFTVAIFDVMLTDKTLLHLKSVSLAGIYFAISSVYLFYAVFLKTIKNILFWKWFFYAGILILAYGDLAVVYTHVMSLEKEPIVGKILVNIVFMLFLYANYQYVFKFRNKEENEK